MTLEPESVEGGPVNVPLNLAESTLTVQDGSVRIKVHVLE